MTADREEWMERGERGHSALPFADFVDWTLSPAAAVDAFSGSRSSGSHCRLILDRSGPSSLCRCLFALLRCPDCWSSTRWAFGPAAPSARRSTLTATGEPAYGRTDRRTSSPWSDEVPLPCADGPLCGSASREKRGEGERGGWQELRWRRERERGREIWCATPRGDIGKLHGGHPRNGCLSILERCLKTKLFSKHLIWQTIT